MKGIPMRFVPGVLLLLLLVSTGAVAPMAQGLNIRVTGGNVDPLPVAIPYFHGGGEETRQVGRDMSRVISDNLERSGLFKAIDRKAFLEKPEDMLAQPNFAQWRVINAQALVTGKIDRKADGLLRVEFRLWDVFASEQMEGIGYKTTPANWRRIAHIISDAIYKRLTGEAGYFDTRIVYVAEKGPPDRREKRLAIMDQDGDNNSYLTDGSYLVLTPRFSPSRQEITYLSYYRDKPRVYIYNIDTGRQEVLGDFPGMTYAPRFSPEGDRVIMSMAQGGNSEIYTMDLRTRVIRRLTRDPAIDTSPCFSPDSRQIVFNSDRGGTQQLYVMNADGSDQRRISFGKGRYATPVWSPRGDLIAFTKFSKGQFHIGVMHPDGSGERLLTTSFLDEAPTWSPNGRVLMFFRQQRNKSDTVAGRVRLRSIDLTGYNEREIITPTDASDPAWSPLAPLN